MTTLTLPDHRTRPAGRLAQPRAPVHHDDLGAEARGTCAIGGMV